VKALVAFRSHIAYAMARREQPDLILATACEDRLIKALRSVPEIPALLAPLAGMERPCLGAVLDLDWLQKHLQVAWGQLLPDSLVQAKDSTGAVPSSSQSGNKALGSAESS
jgi:hypothetical protein